MNIPNVTSVVNFFSEMRLAIRRNSNTFTILANVQNINSQQANTENGSLIALKTKKLFVSNSQRELLINDVVYYDKNCYKITSKEQWNEYGYCTYIINQINASFRGN